MEILQNVHRKLIDASYSMECNVFKKQNLIFILKIFTAVLDMALCVTLFVTIMKVKRRTSDMQTIVLCASFLNV